MMPDADTVDIPAYHRIKPHSAIFPHHHVTYNGGVFCKPATLVEGWVMSADGFYQCHDLIFIIFWAISGFQCEK
jgi:hypothetical protein